MPHNKAQPRRRVNESGNILFLILICVALFAFLSYVVAGSTRTGGGTMDSENVSLRASQIIQYATYVEQAVLRMRFRNIEGQSMCFDNDGWDHNDYYYPACDEPKHQVFSTLPDSGGIIWSRPPAGANDGSVWYIPENICVAGVGKSLIDNCNTDGTGDTEDIVMILPNLALDVCMEINDQLDVTEKGVAPPVGNANMFTPGGNYFTGTFADGTVIDSTGSDPTVLRGKPYGCVAGNGAPPAETYHYYRVLLPR